MNGQKVEHVAMIPAVNSEIDESGISPHSDRTRLIPGSIAFLIFLIITSLYVSLSYPLSRSKGAISMVHSHASDTPLLPITVSLSPLPSTQDTSADARPSFCVNVTLTNTGDVTLVILKWWTPFVHGAPAMGIFKVTDLRWGTAVPDMGLMIDYLFPEDDTFVLREGNDSSDDLLLIRPGESVSKEVKIGDPEVLVKWGKKYNVKAKGGWMAVWKGEDENGRYSMRDAIGNGYFESEAIEVQT
ncbi:hypothetical protein V494_07703 [Pseudogymnoascus sp. VKM F-4513 (FW-928)]|nr:hypothetical protein V494_07703 [Pseudogymnoascus sp. VKM F-4513 (FW-928)]